MTPEYETLLKSIVASGLIGTVIEALKKAGLPSKFAPIASIVLGLGSGLLLIPVLTNDWSPETILFAIGYGFALSATTSFTYDRIKPKKEKNMEAE
jgi:uncharacterized membrane protein